VVVKTSKHLSQTAGQNGWKEAPQWKEGVFLARGGPSIFPSQERSRKEEGKEVYLIISYIYIYIISLLLSFFPDDS
jgi:hypothetical protein